MAKIRSPSISVKLLLIFIFRPFIFLYKVLLMKFVYFKCFRSKFIKNRIIIVISVIKSVRKYIVPDCFLGPVWYFKYLNVFLSCFHRKSFRLLIKCQIFSIKIRLDSSIFQNKEIKKLFDFLSKVDYSSKIIKSICSVSKSFKLINHFIIIFLIQDYTYISSFNIIHLCSYFKLIFPV